VKQIKEVYEEVKSAKAPRMAVASAADADVLKAVAGACALGIVKPILVGDKDKIEKIAADKGLDLKAAEIVDIKDPKEAAGRAVALAKQGDVDIVMKGFLESADFLRAVVNKETGIKLPGRTISAIAVVELKKLGRMVFITDPGFIPLPDKEMKVKIIENAVDAAKKLGVDEPKVALLCAAETVNPKMISTVDASEINEMYNKGEIKDCVVAGPISFDLAISPEAAAHKGYTNPVAGKADILVVPSLETGNILYKSLSYFADMETGGIMTGASVPIVFTSRADTAETKQNTIAFAVCLAQKSK